LLKQHPSTVLVLVVVLVLMLVLVLVVVVVVAWGSRAFARMDRRDEG
jgi:hypothetical protein